MSVPSGSAASDRVAVHRKFFRIGGAKWYARGFTYGSFAPNSRSEAIPEDDRMLQNFACLRDLGANVIRVYFPSPYTTLFVIRLYDIVDGHN